MRRSSATLIPVIALGLGLGVTACRDTQPTATPAPDPRSVSASILPSYQEGPASSDTTRWKLQRTVTTTPGENGTTITHFDFSEAPEWQEIGDTYSDSGLTFQNAMGVASSAYSYYPPNSGSKVVTAIIPPDFTGGDGVLVVTFGSSVTAFSAYATSALPLNLTCYDAEGAVVGTQDLPTPNLNDGKSPYGPNQPIGVTGEGIVRCLFTGTNNYYVLDDFRFSRVAGPKLTVKCDPDSPMPRGEWVRCTATLEPKRTPFTIIERRAEAEGQVYTDTAATTVNGERGDYEYSWAGHAVVNTQVTMKGRVVISRDTITVTSDPVSFSVKSRMDNGSESWPKLTLPVKAPDPRVDDGTQLNYPPFAPDANGHWGGIEGGLGMTHVTTQYFSIRDTTGPNANWLFIENPIAIVDTAIFYSRHIEPTDSFYKQQNGTPVRIGKNLFKGCASTDMDAMRVQVFEHEKAHYAVYQKYFAEHDVQADFERMHIYVDSAAPGAMLPDSALRLEVKRIYRNPIDDLQAPIDGSATAYPINQPCDLHGPFPRT